MAPTPDVETPEAVGAACHRVACAAVPRVVRCAVDQGLVTLPRALLATTSSSLWRFVMLIVLFNTEVEFHICSFFKVRNCLIPHARCMSL